ncbi:MAG: hypothetical protein KAR79_02060 [Simkaniaceae bacterium]|nr:hypothetical protein [Simkaniaceae bacterium]
MSSKVGPSRSSITEARTTLVVEKELFECMKALAFWERKSLKAVLAESFNKYLDTKQEDYIDRALQTYRSHHNFD